MSGCTKSCSMQAYFYAPGLKGPSGASSNRIVRLSVRLSVCNSVPLTNKKQYLKFGWWYITRLGLLVHLWVPHTSLTSHAPGVGRDQNVGLRDFCHSFTLLPAGASVFHKHMSSSYFCTCLLLVYGKEIASIRFSFALKNHPYREIVGSLTNNFRSLEPLHHSVRIWPCGGATDQELNQQSALLVISMDNGIFKYAVFWNVHRVDFPISDI